MNSLSVTHKHTHTHRFNGPLSGTTQVSRYQKGKTNLDFTEARDSEWQWHQLGHMQICTSLQTDNHASTSLLSFLQAGCPSCHPTNSVKALKANSPSVNKTNITHTYTVHTNLYSAKNHENESEALFIVHYPLLDSLQSSDMKRQALATRHQAPYIPDTCFVCVTICDRHLDLTIS